jgi:hypothetical protein
MEPDLSQDVEFRIILMQAILIGSHCIAKSSHYYSVQRLLFAW